MLKRVIWRLNTITQCMSNIIGVSQQIWRYFYFVKHSTEHVTKQTIANL
jgi:hypothetical protein